MEAEAAALLGKYIGAGLACTAMAGAGIGVGNVVGNYLAGALRNDEPMARHTSWRAGGRAQCAYFPRDLQDLALFMRTIPRSWPVYVVGLGSNLLVRDGGVRGAVVFTHGALREVALVQSDDGGEPLVYAQAGVASPKVARFAANHDLRGAEFLAGIPGTVGGALAMNAGCYGSETWDVVHMVLTLDREGKIRRRAPSDQRRPQGKNNAQNSVIRRKVSPALVSAVVAAVTVSTTCWYMWPAAAFDQFVLPPPPREALTMAKSRTPAR